MRDTLFGRLLASNLLIVLFALLITGLMLTALSSRQLLLARERELLAKGQELSQLSAQYIQGHMDEETLTSVLSALEGFLEARIWVIDPRGMVSLESQGRHMEGMRRSWRGTNLTIGEIRPLLEGQTISVQRILPQFPDVMVQMVGVPIMGPDSAVQGGLLLLSPVTGIQEQAARVRRLTVMSMLVGGLLAALASYLASRSLSTPLERLQKAADSMAQGDYASTLPLEGVREISDLSRSFNSLAQNLDQAVSELRHQRQRFEDMIISMSEGVLGLDSEGLPVTMNPAAKKMLGWREGKEMSLNSLPANIRQPVQEVLASGQEQVHTMELEEPRRVIMAHLSPVISGDPPEVDGVVALLQDVSERHELENMRREFVANVSHDLRSPLTAIRAYVEPLIDGTLEDPASRAHYLEIIRDESLRMERLLKDLIDLTRLEAGTLVIRPRPLVVGEVLDKALDRFQAVADSRSVSLEASVEEDLHQALGDEDRVLQVLSNLLDNALKHVQEGGRVQVKAESESPTGAIRITVSDDGRGVSPEHLDKIFERFYRVDPARSREEGGAGLGLAIVKQLVEAMGGVVGVSSQPHRGSSFYFTLPPEGNSENRRPR